MRRTGVNVRRQPNMYRNYSTLTFSSHFKLYASDEEFRQPPILKYVDMVTTTPTYIYIFPYMHTYNFTYTYICTQFTVLILFNSLRYRVTCINDIGRFIVFYFLAYDYP